MLRAVPASLFAFDYTILEDGRPVAEIDQSWVAEYCELSVRGRPYRIHRDPPLIGTFELIQGYDVIATATKPSAFIRAFDVRFQGQSFRLTAVNPFFRRFELRSGNGQNTLGAVYPPGLFTRSAVADLPTSLPLEVRTFMIWLVLTIWRRRRRSN